jgi:hypothetical protein
MKRGLMFFAALAAAAVSVSLAAGSAFAGSVVYNAVPSSLPPNVASLGFEATSTSEFGDYVHLAGTNRRLNTATVTMSDWALYSDYSSDARYSANSTTWSHPITLNVYSNHLGASGAPDTLLATTTQSITIPWRPVADPTCSTPTAWRASDHQCYNGLAFNATFNLGGLNVQLPNDVIVGVAYNTADYGAVPNHTAGPYNSLNVGAPDNQTASVGTDDNADNVFWNTSLAGFYNDGGAAGFGIFRQDTHWTPNGTVAVQIVASPPCVPTGFIRDGINMTAAQIGGNVTGNIDAAGCNIGVYYDNSHPQGNVTNANIHGANYFGVVVNGDSGTMKVNVTGSNIHDIGETPLNGDQHGNAIYYRALGAGTASGAISGNTITNYQKGGITTNGNVSATITNNTVTGQGPVDYIAQNGIQVGYGAKATVTGNTVTGNAYTGANLASSGGILVVGGPCYGLPAYTVGLSITNNNLTGNDVGVWLSNGDASCNAPATKTNNSVKFNTISNATVTNKTGDTAHCGYQAGVSDLGTKDQIVSNTISGFGYTPTVGGDCTGTMPAFLRFIDAGSSARGVGSNK